MINWPSIKQAADVNGNPMPFGGPMYANNLPFRQPGNGLKSWGTYQMSSNSAYEGPFVRANPVTYRDQRRRTTSSGFSGMDQAWLDSFMKNVGATRQNVRNAPKGLRYYTLPIRNIRPAMYGNSPEQRAREQEDTRRAMQNRWADLYAVANHRQANRLDRLRAQGYMPPILTPNSKEIVWSDFIHPDAKVNITAYNDPNGRASTYPPRQSMNRHWDTTPNMITLPMRDDPSRIQSTGRHELSHVVTAMNDASKSVVPGIPGGDEGEEAASRGELGSYELDPDELYRWMFMQKALAGANGDAPFTNVNEWVKWYNNRIHNNVLPGDQWPALGDPSVPGRASNGAISGNDARADSMVETINTLAEQIQDPKTNPYTKRRAKDQYIKIMNMIQHAIDTADVGRTAEGMNA